MHKITKQALIPALTTISLLAAGCSSVGTGKAGRVGDAAEAAGADGVGGAAAAPAAELDAAGDTGQGGGATGDGRRLPVTAVPAPSAPSGATAVARPSRDGHVTHKSSLRIASYDRRSGRAVIAGAVVAPKGPSGASGSSSPAPSASASGSPAPSAPVPSAPAPSVGSEGAGGTGGTEVSDGAGGTGGAAKPAKPASPGEKSAVVVGDVIASAPAPGAPSGVLAKVTKVLGTTHQGTEVNTAPATLDALLGKDEADGKVPVDPAGFSVEPLVKGVKVSWAKNGGRRFGPQGATLPLGSLRLDVGASVATAEGAPADAAASVSGFVQLSPKVEFGYHGNRTHTDSAAPGTGTGTAPRGAYIGLSGDWSSQWQFKGRAAASTGKDKPLRMPFAKLHADPVVQVGPVPVVVNLDLTCYLAVEADGRITVDVKQDLKGGFRVGGSYSWARGWKPVSESGLKATPVQAAVTAAGRAKAVLGAEAGVGLYGMAGVSADIAPYLRGEGSAVVTGSSDGKGSATADWKAFGGLDLSGSLQAQLTVFGTPLFQKRIPLGALHREWQLAAGRLSSSARQPHAG
ncbi:hypothetical protein GKJPGBOP_08023 [Streptomyces paromomycinus]|uniref:Lipoprotein n=1 Tax=Streptomyces paromomycinus TaxID=92743 RepID=A0A401WFX2_STREY|nr:hypothetical protein [Streptomyces paromomycinus]GCD48227.1 hypothetical protein GKJPGBOP_08023 [Streptomyces paromomycinus]